MTETSHGPVRWDLITRLTLETLLDGDRPMRQREVVDQMRPQIDFTEYESEIIGKTEPQPRWMSGMGWLSVDLKNVGWLTKELSGWQITETGREALRDYPGDGEGMLAVARNATNELMRSRAGDEQPGYRPILEAAFNFIGPGQWTTYGDLAAVANTNAQTVGSTTRESSSDGAHRVLQKSGKPSPGFKWLDDRTETQREVLEQEGVVFDESGVASERQRLRTVDFRAYLEQRGTLSVSARRAWLVRGSSIDGHDLTEEWRRDGYVSLKAAKLRSVDPGISRPDLKAIVEEDYSQSAYSARMARLDDFYAFLSRMKNGDLIATTSQGHLYFGAITGDVEYIRPDDGWADLRRDATWQGGGVSYDTLPKEVTARFNQQYDVVEMTQQLDILEAPLTDESAINAAKVHELVLPDATDSLAESLNVDRRWLDECIELLRDRPQLIFYGPPGTGKTYIARALAAHLTGDMSHVRLVQFHPAFSYEDFFEGYRPTPLGTFELRPGPLRKTVDAARENPGAPYVLIIDEINRGNLAKIFGELYFLLEYRGENVDLLYATDDDIGFTLPDNVFIIGTMNTADRSIALVDAAMRRRFAFVALHPGEAPVRDVLRRWLIAHGHNTGVADLLDELNARTDDPDFKIGPSYFMRDAVYVDRGLERTWRTAILPLLEEHHYGDATDVAARYGLDAIRARVAAKTKVGQDRDESTPDPA